jgi:gamma-glutamyltranspeptidase
MDVSRLNPRRNTPSLVKLAERTARFTVSPQRGWNIVIESRVTPEVRQKLSAMGHQLDVRHEYSTAMGRGQAVLRCTVRNPK